MRQLGRIRRLVKGGGGGEWQLGAVATRGGGEWWRTGLALLGFFVNVSRGAAVTMEMLQISFIH